MPDTDPDPPKIKKKRGRKPKVKKTDEEVVEKDKKTNPKTPTVIVKKKRGRKKKYDLNGGSEEVVSGLSKNSIDIINNNIYFSNAKNVNNATAEEEDIPKDSEAADPEENSEESIMNSMETEVIELGCGFTIKKTNDRSQKKDNYKLQQSLLLQEKKKSRQKKKEKAEAEAKEEQNEFDLDICQIDLSLIEVKEKVPTTKKKEKIHLDKFLLCKKEEVDKKVECPEGASSKQKKNSKNSESILLRLKKINLNKEPDVTIMMKFGNEVSEAPKKTDILCWWCCHSFDSFPCFIPTKRDPIKNRYKVTGTFCSWNCANSYYVKEFRSNRKGDIFYTMLKDLKLDIKIKDLKHAPPKETLKCFGGILSIEEFRAASCKNNSTIYKVRHAFEADEGFRVTGC